MFGLWNSQRLFCIKKMVVNVNIKLSGVLHKKIKYVNMSKNTEIAKKLVNSLNFFIIYGFKIKFSKNILSYKISSIILIIFKIFLTH